MGRKKPGPKGLLKNPRPAEEWVTDDDGREVFLGRTDEVGPLELDVSERTLRDYFGKHREQLVARRGEAPREAVWRITRLATNALSETGVVWWSGYEREQTVDNPSALETPRRQPRRPPEYLRELQRRWNPPSLRRISRPWGKGGTRRHVGTTPPPKAEHKCLWLDTSTVPAMLKQYDRHTQTWTWNPAFMVHQSIAGYKDRAEKWLADMTRPLRWLLHTSWPGVMTSSSLRDSIAHMLRGEAKLANKSGRPGYLACATLGTLLDRTPEQIAAFLGNYRRSLRPRRRRPRA